MARIPVPYAELSELFRIQYGLKTSDGFGFALNTARVYNRIDGKFVPIGWSVEPRRSQYRQEYPLLVFLDREVANIFR
jgi:hypothetical protein